MASITCEINITNKWINTKFFLFQDIPAPTDGPSGQVFTNVFQVSPKVEAERDGSSTLSFSMDNTFYAIFGTSTGEGSKTRIKTNSFKKIKLGPNGSVVAITNDKGGIIWDETTVQGKKSSDKGGFEFLTNELIPGADNTNLYIGVGATDPNQPAKVVPLQTYKAEPSLDSKLFPKLTYFVATGEFEPGQLVDRTKIGKWVKLDFEGAKVPKAFVVLQEDGLWIDDNLQSQKNEVKVEASD